MSEQCNNCGTNDRHTTAHGVNLIICKDCLQAEAIKRMDDPALA